MSQNQNNRPIQRLDKQVSDQLTSQQIIPTLHECIKQLIDNAIDAKATTIKIQLQQYGKLTFSVYDNGTGIRQVQKLGESGTTSKLASDNNNINYLNDVKTLGFRGQAVNSIANLCKQMTIHTLYCQPNIIGLQQYKFTEMLYSVTRRAIIDKKSSLMSSSSTSTFSKITVQNLFYNVPVRKYQLQNKPKQNLKKVYQLLFQISLIFPQITFILINSIDGKEELLFQAQKYTNKNIKKQPEIVHQNYFSKDMSKQAWKQRIQICFPQKLDDCLVFIKSKNVQGYILNTIQSGSSKKNMKFPKNLQYTFINRRPVNPLKQVCRIFDGFYKKYNPYTKYVFFLNLRISPDEIDVNLSPNKRDIFIKKDRLQNILRQIRELIQKQVIEKITNLQQYRQARVKKEQTRSEKKQNNRKLQQQDGNNNINQQIEYDESNKTQLRRFINKSSSQPIQSQQQDSIKIRQQVFNSRISQVRHQKLLKGNYLGNYQRVNAQINNSMIDQLNRRVSSGSVGICSKINLLANKQVRVKEEKEQKPQQKQYEINSESEQEEKQKLQQQQRNSPNKEDNIQLNDIPLKINNDQLKNSIINALQQSFQLKKQNTQQPLIKIQPIQAKRQTTREEDKRQAQKSQIKIENYQFQSKEQMLHNKKLLKTHKPQFDRDFNPQKASQKIAKQQQPNCCLHEHQNKQNSLLNSHSSTNKNNQQLLQPNYDIKIDDFQIPDNINFVSQQNQGQITKKDFKHFHIHGQFNKGFILCSFEQKKYLYIIDQHASQEKRLFQTYMESKPMYYYLSKEVQLTPMQVDQVEMAREELLQSGFTFSIENRTTLKLMRCPSHFKKNFGFQEFMQIVQTNKNIKQIPSFYNSAASKACRTAVMIGDQLGKNRMVDIVHKMSDLKSPWNCPHGRPSLISLGSFQSIIKKIKTPKQKYKF